MPFGYNGKILRVNLNTRDVAVETPTESFYRTYVGGSCLSLYYLLKELEAGTDPLGPNNLLVFASSVISGVPVGGTPRFTVAARSPLTGGFGESEAGGFWGPELKRSGFDAIVIKGRARNPVYLWINDGNVELRDASHLWGLDTGTAQRLIQQELADNNIRVAIIGQGGEAMVRYACILNNLKHINGRTGMGAVMGSKNLKAIAVRGTRKVEVADPISLREIGKSFINGIKKHPGDQALRNIGTPIQVMPLNNLGILPTRNFSRSQFEGAEKICGEVMKESISIGNEGCFSCAIRCKRKVEVKGRYEVSSEYGGPEYETIAAFGSSLGIDNIEAIAKANELCNRYSIDTISTGVSIAFAMECFEKGILTQKDTEGLELRFGNVDAMLKMVENIGLRQGLGDLLGEGVKRASEKLGDHAKKYALHIKGQELPLHDPRGKFSVGLGYAVSPTGADHLEAPHDTSFQQLGPMLSLLSPLGIYDPISALDIGPEKIRFFRHTQLIFSLWNCLGICNFAVATQGVLSLGEVVKMVQSVTGWDTSLFELLRVSDRMMTMARIFNLREGFGRNDDKLPDRLFEPLPDGPNKGQRFTKENLEEAKDLYYEMMGWDKENGKPLKGKLVELNLNWLVE